MTVTDNGGKKDPCSGTRQSEDKAGITVRVKPHGRGKVRTTWQIPFGVASERCGFNYDLIHTANLVSHTTSAGTIGARHLLLANDGNVTFNETNTSGTFRQQLRWNARVVLERTMLL